VSETVEIVDYDPAWPGVFARQALLIAQALGERAVAIEHVGSTAAPGLPAKPVIDINLAVADTTREADYVPALEAAGFEFRFREPEWFEHRFFRRETPRVNLHVFGAGCSELDVMRAFRDHLRGDAADRALYAQVKRDLAGRQWARLQDYADAKAQVVAEIMARAMAGAAQATEG
jgi:GrpB-like predicted nucleotidyltransferase (UPF0157 family)